MTGFAKSGAGWGKRGLALGPAFIAACHLIGRARAAEGEAATSNHAAAYLVATIILGAAALMAAGALFNIWRRSGDQRRALAALELEKAALAAEMRVRDDRSAELAAKAVTDAAADAKRQDELRQLVEPIELPIWRRNAELAIIDCNRAYMAAVEAQSVEQVVAEDRELAAGAIGRRGKALAEAARAEGQAQRQSVHVVVGGSRRLLEIVEVPLPQGGVTGYAIEQTALEAARAELERHVSAEADVMEKLGSAIAIYSPDQRLRFFNAAYARLWRLDEEWLRTQPSYGEILEAEREQRRLPEHADFPAFKRERLRLFTSVIVPQEELIHLPDGTTLHGMITPHPLGGLLFTYEDVTDKLILERNYNTLIAVQRETIDSLHEGVAVFGGDLRLKLFNPSFAAMWWRTGERPAPERHLSELLEDVRDLFNHKGDWTACRDRIVERVTDRTPEQGELERADGVMLVWSKVPLPDGAVAFGFLDVTDSIRVERALRERNEALVTADRLKSEFIANVSYELRTPLNAIIGFAEILNNRYFGDLNAKQLEYTAGILDASNRLLSLVNDILDLAMIEAGRMTIDREPVDIHTLMVSVLNLTRDWGRKQNLTFLFDCPPDIGSVVADERRLKQVLVNLVSNAIKFSPKGGRIGLNARREGGDLVLAVSDTGRGIPREDQERVFEKFERGRGQQSRGGAGLGLSLVRSFIELHGGRVELESVPHQGTTVRCYLPIVIGAAALPPQAKDAAEASRDSASAAD